MKLYFTLVHYRALQWQYYTNPKSLEVLLMVAHCTPEVQSPLEQLQDRK